jgi:hypothetical protein
MHAHQAGGNGAGDAGIAWRRLAEPQPDQYDTLIALDFLQRRGYARQEVGAGPSFFDRQVAIRNEPPEAVSFPPACVPTRPDHPNIARACELVRLWRPVFRQFHLLIDSVSVFTYRHDTSVSRHAGRPGAIAATVDNAVAFAECLVHEMAHHKLRALGVDIKSAERLIRNPPTQKFKSPIRMDCLRPISAVVHAEYSYTYVAALDLEIVRSRTACADDRADAAHALARHLPKLEFGLGVIRDHAEVDEPGAAFMEAWQAWLARVFAAGDKVLDAWGIRPRPFVHPLDSTPAHAGLRPSRLSSIRERRFGDELRLYVPEHELATLNHSAAAIWQLCDGKRTIEEISEELGPCVGRSGVALLPDVIQGVTRLHELGLLELR